jgi:hypothetical protein
LREIEQRFTKSEIVLYAWRSQEQYYQFQQRMAKNQPDVSEEESEEEDYEEVTGNEDVDRILDAVDRNYNLDRKKEIRRKKRIKKKVTGKIPQNLPDRFYNKDGEVDLRQVTGEDAMKYFSKQGIPLPVFQRNK